MNVVINVSDFMDHLKSNDLVIVHRADYDSKKVSNRIDENAERKRIMKLDAITVGQVVKYKLLPYTTFNGVKKSNLFNEGEMFQDVTGKYMVCTSAIKRLNTSI
jgi:hypothetical protein